MAKSTLISNQTTANAPSNSVLVAHYPEPKSVLIMGEMQRISVIGGVLRTGEVLVLGVDSGIRRLGGDMTRASRKVHGRT
jgi:hypothetical protein